MLPYSGIRTARKLYTGGGRDGQYLQDTVCMSEKARTKRQEYARTHYIKIVKPYS